MMMRKTQLGFSLIEILVSLALFTVVVTVSVGALLSLIGANQKAQTIKTSMDNLSFAIDTMTRNIRTGYEYHCQADLADAPTALPGGTRNCLVPENGFVYTDGETGDRIAYRLHDNKIERRITDGGVWLPLTADDMQVDTLLFGVSGSTATNEEQPAVSIWIDGQVGDFDDTRSLFELQTTVVQRVLDI